MSKVTGTQVRQAREKAGLSVKELAAKCNISERSISRIEAGHRVKALSLNKVAAALKLLDASGDETYRGLFPTAPYRRGQPVQLRSGLELFQFYSSGWSSPDADLFFECEAPDGQAGEALEDLADAVELIRQATLGPRDRLHALQKFTRGMQVLIKDGWSIEGQEWARDVFDQDYDSIAFSRVTVRPPAKARPRAVGKGPARRRRTAR